VAELLNPTSSILPYSARLCLNKPGMLCTGKVFFNIEAGKTKSIYFSTEVPTVEGTYPVYLDVFSNDQLLEAYRAAEDVVVGLLKYTLEVTVEPPGAAYIEKSPSKATYSAGEVVTLIAHPYPGYEFDHWGGWPPYPGVGSTSDILKITMDADWWIVAALRKAVPIEGFVLGIKNPPAGAVLWNGNFAEKCFDYEPMADSGWLAIDRAWEYPSDPRGCTTLRIWILNANNNILLDVKNLGPVNKGKSYIFNCITKKLEI
ncbi:unnamed protein product, partial [marine sediment metagenome]